MFYPTVDDVTGRAKFHENPLNRKQAYRIIDGYSQQVAAGGHARDFIT
jgi:hypothetical protein